MNVPLQELGSKSLMQLYCKVRNVVALELDLNLSIKQVELLCKYLQHLLIIIHYEQIPHF